MSFVPEKKQGQIFLRFALAMHIVKDVERVK